MFESGSTPAAVDPAVQRQPTGSSGVTTASRINSHNLLRGGRDLLIGHAGQGYRLHLTRNDKLILTK